MLIGLKVLNNVLLWLNYILNIIKNKYYVINILYFRNEHTFWIAKWGTTVLLNQLLDYGSKVQIRNCHCPKLYESQEILVKPIYLIPWVIGVSVTSSLNLERLTVNTESFRSLKNNIYFSWWFFKWSYLSTIRPPTHIDLSVHFAQFHFQSHFLFPGRI